MNNSLDDLKKTIGVLVRARYPLLYLVTWEEQRADQLFRDLVQNQSKALYHWSVTGGYRRADGGVSEISPSEDSTDPFAALNQISTLSAAAVICLKDFHAYLDDPKVIRRLRELSYSLKSTYKTVVIVSPILTLPIELQKDVTVLDMPLPTPQELATLLREIVEVVRTRQEISIQLSAQHAEELVRAAMGMTLLEAENAFARAIVEDSRLCRNDIDEILDEKIQIIRKSELLDYTPASGNFSDVGGLDQLKQWLGQRKKAFTNHARSYGLPPPKGVLLIGVPGCGKSLVAKSIADLWRLPLLRLDIGQLFSRFMGGSEENIRRAIKITEGVAPVVLWLDELEKSLSGNMGNANDGGTSSRVFSTLLTWLQEKTSAVFVVATANKIEQLPPELLRKGRFDDTFFIDLPSVSERRQIFEIHLRKHRRDPTHYALDRLADQAAGFSGAEIEQAIISAMFSAFDQAREFTTDDICTAIDATVPLAITMAEPIDRLRTWAKARARPASADDSLATNKGR